MSRITELASKLLKLSTQNDSQEAIDEYLEIVSEREKLTASQTNLIEDPSLKESVLSPNHNAYLMDVEQFY